jgi:hypothetical protein
MITGLVKFHNKLKHISKYNDRKFVSRERDRMATFYDSITVEQAKLIDSSKLFFVATADPKLRLGTQGEGPVNLSPKGGVPLRRLGSNRIAYLDYVGSGNETFRHTSMGGPITVMVCAFDGKNTAVVRLYGYAHAETLDADEISGLLHEEVAQAIGLPERQIIVMDIEKTTTSCGYGVPVMSFISERTVNDHGRLYKQKK